MIQTLPQKQRRDRVTCLVGRICDYSLHPVSGGWQKPLKRESVKHDVIVQCCFVDVTWFADVDVSSGGSNFVNIKVTENSR